MTSRIPSPTPFAEGQFETHVGNVMEISRHFQGGMLDSLEAYLRFAGRRVEPTRGIEPRTPSLRVKCSAS